MQTINSLAIAELVLAFSCFFAVFLMLQKKSFVEQGKTLSTATLLGFLLMALSAVTSSLRYGISNYWLKPHEMLNNAATYLSPPLIGLACCLAVLGRQWQRPAWLRVIFGVCLCYEVSRWYGLDLIYRDLQLAVLLFAVAYSLFQSKIKAWLKWLILAGLTAYGSAFFVVGTEGYSAGYLNMNLWRYLIGLGNLLLSSGLYLVLKLPEADGSDTAAQIDD